MPDGTITEYKYDPFGRRIEETVTANGVSSITRNLYDGANILNEYDGNDLLQVSYVHNLGIDDPLSIEKNGGIYYYHKDGLGSVTALTDATGSKVQSYEYDSFGNLLSQTGTLNQPYTYTGREYDPETGLYYYRARYYDSKLGRFITKDPIGFNGGDVNVFNYARGNAVNWMDPFGLFRSPESLRLLVPGQVTWDDAVTSFENGAYIDASLSTSAMVGEQVLAVLTLGESGAAQLANISLGQLSDWVRIGETTVSRQLIDGPGAKGFVRTCAIKGGGTNPETGFSLPFHYHIHKYNWYKPWLWFKYTPVLKK